MTSVATVVASSITSASAPNGATAIAMAIVATVVDEPAVVVANPDASTSAPHNATETRRFSA